MKHSHLRLIDLARKHFWLIIAALLLPSAYFQARAVSCLLTAELLVPHAPVAGVTPRDVRIGERNISAEPILSRNPFDSATGPLTPKAGLTPERTELDLSDPLHAPTCQGIRAESTAESTDPLWSSAVLQGPDDEHGKLRRVGHRIGDYEVTFIGFNPVQLSPAVWLVSGSELCQALVFSEEKAKAWDKSKRAPKRKRPSSKNSRRSRKAPRLPKGIAKRIRKISATEYVVQRSAVEEILEDNRLLSRSIRIKPRKTKTGTRLVLSRVRRGSLLSHIGLKPGDEVKAINGYSLAGPENALKAYAHLRTASSLRLDLERDRRPLTIEYRIQ